MSGKPHKKLDAWKQGIELTVETGQVRGWRSEVGGELPRMTSCKASSEYIFPFEKLDVWQLAVDLADFVLGLLGELPGNKHIRLVGQMEAAATSPAQNIAEGKGRQYKKEFIQFLHIAQGSLYELVTLSEIFHRRKLFKMEDCAEIRDRCEKIDRKLNGLINSLRGHRGRTPGETLEH